MSDTKAYFVHGSSFVDEPCTIGEGTKIWHFCHVMKNAVIVASFVYHTANRDQLLPRKPLPKPQPQGQRGSGVN